MDKPYFVMIYDQHGSAVVMTDGEDVAFFETWDEADDAAKANMLAQACGHEVHKMGSDCV